MTLRPLCEDRGVVVLRRGITGWFFAHSSLPRWEDDCFLMRQLPRWQQIPRLYRLVTILFAATDIVILAVAAAGLRSWFHGGGSVVQSFVYLLLLYPFFARTPVAESWPRHERSSRIARIVAGVAILFLSAWILIGGIVEYLRGVSMPEYVLEGVVFTMFLTATGALLVWRGWQRRRGEPWATFPGTPTSLRRHTYGEKRNYVASFVAFFILGSAVLVSFNFYDGAIAFQPFGWLVIPIGFGTAAAILIANRQLPQRARTCFGCGQHVPLGATACPSCSRLFP